MSCSDASSAAQEPLSATATSAERWLLVEVPGPWPRDVSAAGTLPPAAQEAVSEWLARTPRSRLLFVRRPGRTTVPPAVFAVHAEESHGEVLRLRVATHEELATVDLDRDGEQLDHELVLVCGHGSRDRCCALRGTAVFGALVEDFAEERLWITSHHGGHRFAANVLVLPSGLHLGRLDPAVAAPIVTRALDGRIDLDHYRGRTCYEPRVQAADHALRASLGLRGVHDLRLVEADANAVRFRTPDGGRHEALVEEVDGPAVPASCGDEPAPQAHFRAGLVA